MEEQIRVRLARVVLRSMHSRYTTKISSVSPGSRFWASLLTPYLNIIFASFRKVIEDDGTAC